MSHTDKDAAKHELSQCLRDALSALLEVRPANPLQQLGIEMKQESQGTNEPTSGYKWVTPW